MTEFGVLAVVVTYHPDPDVLLELLRSLCRQVERVILVDNTPREDVSGELSKGLSRDFPGVTIDSVGENIGVAAALNRGLRVAQEEGFQYVLLSDQDSLPAPRMVETLVATLHDLESLGVPVGCVSPEYIDRVTGQSFQFQVQEPGRLMYHTIPGSQATPWAEVLTTITSGTLVPVEVVEAVGGMREDFFIDHVDVEWCHRARDKGYRLFGTGKARMMHQLGDDVFRTWFFGWRQCNAYAPARLYYRFRNFALLCRLEYVPASWKLRASVYWAHDLYARLFFAHDRLRNAAMIARGLLDGIRGRSGAYSP